MKRIERLRQIKRKWFAEAPPLQLLLNAQQFILFLKAGCPRTHARARTVGETPVNWEPP